MYLLEVRLIDEVFDWGTRSERKYDVLEGYILSNCATDTQNHHDNVSQPCMINQRNRKHRGFVSCIDLQVYTRHLLWTRGSVDFYETLPASLCMCAYLCVT